MPDRASSTLHARPGLTSVEAGDLSNYYHFREPTALAKKSVLERRGLVASTDFLDSLAEDSPKGVWAVRVDKSRGQATLRSLAWPGYFFFHNVGTARFGGAYFGDGRRNNDIGFMV
jgi:radial spoke head protein 9